MSGKSSLMANVGHNVKTIFTCLFFWDNDCDEWVREVERAHIMFINQASKTYKLAS